MTFSSANRRWILRAGVSVLAVAGFFLLFAGNPPGTAASQAEVPGVPSNIQVQLGHSGELVASWRAPASDGGSAITGYKVQWKEAADSWDTPTSVSETMVTGTSHTISGLTDGTEYTVRIIAVNGIGDGPPSSEETCPGGYDPEPTPVEVEAIPIVVESTTAEYFVLYVKHDLDGTEVELPVSVTLGQDGTTTLAENVEALPKERYRVEKYLIADPADVDGDCIDDITELDDLGNMNPVNPAAAIPLSGGVVVVPDAETFKAISYTSRYGKFVLIDMDTASPRVYFINITIAWNHRVFLEAIGLDPDQDGLFRGQLNYDPEMVAPDGGQGVYFYSLHDNQNTIPPYSTAARFHTVLAANTPLLDNNLALHVSNHDLPDLQDDLPLYRASRIPLLSDQDVYQGTNLLALNPGEGYGRLRVMELDERPNPRDIVLYEALPNELPRIAGIITSVPQTPLSHVNLRAIQDGVPNVFIRDALDEPEIALLIDRYVHFTVTEDGYTIRAATPEEVDAHHAMSRPTHPQTPERDLSVTAITPLSEIGFDDWESFGVKAANVAVLRTLGFPEGTVPDGFAVPFYFYDEFMKHNGLYDDITAMLADLDFQADFDVQEDELKDLRKAIKDGETPEWMTEALTTMHGTYPEGQSLRYRSSTNNEDLPGFNGAGLYDSKTQHPEETEEDGVAKSLKQVYASLWNFRAFTERDFHRIDHLAAAMGVLVHPNYSDELANGVAVSFDPMYGIDGTHYVNTQVGEDLVTNPDAHSVPEEIVLFWPDFYPDFYRVRATSNQVEPGQLLMSDDQMGQLREHLEVIHEEFTELYNPASDDPFAMEIEFKITSEDILAIKQARPWVFSQTPADVASDTNTPAIGQPTISGTAHVGETLTAETAAINDDDGLSNVVYSYQWLADDTEIAGATDPTYTLVDADAGLTIKVKVSFFDDKNNPETLTSAATTAVLANVPDAPEHLNVSLHDTGALDVSWEAPARDGGSAVTGYRVQWKETAGNWDIPADVSEETVTGTTHTITELTDGVEYAVRIIAANDVGEGPPSDEATGTPRETTPPELSTATVDGATLTLTYDEDLDENSEPSSDAFSVTVGGTGRAVDGVSVSGSSVILTLGSAVASGATVTVSYAAPADTAAPRIQDEAGNPAASFSDQDVENNTPPPANTPATGAPIISGMAQVGETLTVDTSGIDDADGIGNATFSYEWIAGTTDISGATGSSYAPLVADLGKTIKVRVSFMDGASNVETLTSEATATVVTPLTAEFQDAPDKHLGTGFFTFDIAFSEPISISYKTLRDDSLEVTNGSATKAKRVDGQSDLWKITVEPDSDADVTVVLPITEDCAAQDAVCTRDGTKLSNRSELTVPGPAAANSPATGAPIISGTAEVGETLTVDTSGIDDADGMSGAVFSYQWLANDAEITGATGDTYTLVEADVGKAVKVRVIFNDDDDNEETLTSEATASVAPRPNTPATGAPTIIGTAQVGETLTVDTSGIDDADGLDNATFSYQWIAGTTDIAGATDPTYTLVADDVGKAIKVRVSFDDDRNNQETLTSEATATVVTPLTAEFRDAPDKHLGTGVFTFLIALSEPISISYKTLRDGSLEVTNGSATKAKRVDGQSDLWEITIEPDSNADVTVVLPVTEDCESDGAVCTRDGMGLSNRSELTVPGPAAANSPATGAPIISGTARVGETLTVDTSGIDDADGMSGAVFSYQWLADGVDIAGATSDTYTPVADDVGKAVKVRVIFNDDDDNEETLTSEATAAVEAKPNSPATGAPTISGTVRVGEILTAHTSDIADPDGLNNVEYNFNWGAGDYLRVMGDYNTYRVQSRDVGLTISVAAGFTDDAGNLESLVSANTVAVAPTTPAPPQNLNVSHHGTGELDLSWEAPISDLAGEIGGEGTHGDGGSPITGYKVQWKSGSEDYDGSAGSTRQAEITDPASRTHTITGLTDGVEYTVRVIAVNDIGDGPPSDDAMATPRETTPPELATATVDGTTLTLIYDEALDEASGLVSDTFSVTVGGTGRAVDGVSVSGSSVILTLGSAVASGATVTVSYTVPMDAGAPRIQDEAGNPAASFSDQDVENNTPPPANSPATRAPTISGTAQVGETLTAQTRDIEDDDGLDNAVFTYQWLADDTDIAGATDPTYTLVDDDAGLTIKVKVSFFDDKNYPETLTSAATAAVEPRPNTPATGAPTISGTVRVGETLTAETRDIEDDDGLDNVGYSYQWLANGADIAGATSDTYTLVDTDVGKTIKVKVSFRDDRNHQESLTSAATAAVATAADESAVWSATLTVGSIAGFRGFWKDVGMGELTSEVFTLDGVDYTVKVLADTNGLLFDLTLDKALPVGFTLQVGATTLSSQDASIREYSSGATQYGWANQGVILADVDTVEVSLTLAE